MCIFYIQLDIKLDFESQSYAVDNKNDPEIPVIKITYPTVYYPSRMFPINIKIETKDDTATGKSLHTNFVKCLTTYQIESLSTIKHNSRIYKENYGFKKCVHKQLQNKMWFNTGHRIIGTKLLALAIYPFHQPKHTLELKLLNFKTL